MFNHIKLGVGYSVESWTFVLVNLEGVFHCCYNRPSNYALQVFSNLDQVFEILSKVFHL